MVTSQLTTPGVFKDIQILDLHGFGKQKKNVRLGVFAIPVVGARCSLN